MSGVTATWNGAEILAGKASFLNDSGIFLDAPIELAVKQQFEQGRTAVLIALNKQIIGLIAIADEIRPDIIKTIQLFKKMGVKRITMLTGDNPQAAQAVAKEIGVDDFQANLLPKQKQDIVRELQTKGYIVGMIGDGVNDAPALALADVGIAMANGSDVAIETANVTVMNDNLSSLAVPSLAVPGFSFFHFLELFNNNYFGAKSFVILAFHIKSFNEYTPLSSKNERMKRPAPLSYATSLFRSLLVT